jgi:predicted HTH transcriptional regulator
VKQTPIDTQRELAEIAGVSHDTISKNVSQDVQGGFNIHNLQRNKQWKERM